MESRLHEKEILSLISSWKNSPELYFEQALGIDNLWDGERAILRAVPVAIKEKKNIVVPSGHSLGKDFVCGGLVPYFLQVYGPCVVITTAPTGRQVDSVMWGEIESRYNSAKIKLPGRLMTSKIEVDSKWYALGFTTKETGQMVGKFQGFHSPRVFVIASEAQAISDVVYEQIDAILTGDIGLLIEIGNPLRATGQFARDIKNTKDNLVIHLSCLDSPNYIQRKTVVPGVCSYEWVEKKRKQWGEDDPRWVARVLGKVPTSSIDTVFSQDLVDKRIDAETFSAKVKRGVAIDVARFGDDETVIYGGTNGIVEAQDIYTQQSTTTTAARGMIIHNKIKKGNFIVVDGDGVGGGTIDTLTDMQLSNVDIMEIHGAGKPFNDDYQNKRAEMTFIAQKRLEEGEASIPNDTLLIEELLEIKYFVNKRGKIQIEEKDDLKERLGRSPNRADAWIMLQYGFSQASHIKTKDGWGSLTEENTAIGVAGAGQGAMVG